MQKIFRDSPQKKSRRLSVFMAHKSSASPIGPDFMMMAILILNNFPIFFLVRFPCEIETSEESPLSGAPSVRCNVGGALNRDRAPRNAIPDTEPPGVTRSRKVRRFKVARPGNSATLSASPKLL